MCWDVLTDVPRLVTWVSIIHDAVELAPLEKYSAVLLDRVGPFKMRADLDIVLSDVRHGESIHVHASGEDRHLSSRLGVDVGLVLRPLDQGSGITLTGTYEVIGKVATLGAGVIKQKANRILDDFFSHAAAELGVSS